MKEEFTKTTDTLKKSNWNPTIEMLNKSNKKHSTECHLKRMDQIENWLWELEHRLVILQQSDKEKEKIERSMNEHARPLEQY
jgi:hypothetical protein